MAVPFSGPESGTRYGPGFRPRNVQKPVGIGAHSATCTRAAAAADRRAPPGSTPAAPAALQKQDPKTVRHFLAAGRGSFCRQRSGPRAIAGKAGRLKVSFPADFSQQRRMLWRAKEHQDAKAALHVTLLHSQFWVPFFGLSFRTSFLEFRCAFCG